MSRIEDILVRVSDTLADPNMERWPKERLLRLIDEAQKDICRRAKLLRTKVSFAVYDGLSTYKLPSDVLLLDRVLFNNKNLPLVSHNELDERNQTWETEVGEVQACVFDKQNRGYLKLYPIPVVDSTAGEYEFALAKWQEDIIYDMNTDFGVVVSGELGDTIDSDYGVLVDVDSFYYVYVPPGCKCDGLTEIPDTISSDYGILAYLATIEKDIKANDSTYGVTVSIEDYAISSDYGLLASIVDDDFSIENFNSDYGILTGWAVSNSELTVYYIKKPTTITSITSELEIDDIFDSAIKYYVTGKALRDDMDTQNRVVGNEELKFYDRELAEAIKDDFADFTRSSSKQYEVRYKGAF